MLRKYKVEIELFPQRTIIVKKFFTQNGCARWLVKFSERKDVKDFSIIMYIKDKFVDEAFFYDEYDQKNNT